MRGRFGATTPEAEIRGLQRQRFDRELQWEGYATEGDIQFAGIVNAATATNRCTQRARNGER